MSILSVLIWWLRGHKSGGINSKRHAWLMRLRLFTAKIVALLTDSVDTLSLAKYRQDRQHLI